MLSSISGTYSTVLADPPWRFNNRGGKASPEHKRLHRYKTLSFQEIKNLPVESLSRSQSHLYLWCPNSFLKEGIEVVESWGFVYKTNIVWYKTRKDGGPDRRGCGFYFRGVTENLLFGVRGSLQTLKPGRTQPNIILECKREHSRKPEGAYTLIESCSPGPYLELFARYQRDGWASWGDQINAEVEELFV